ncbi:MAG: antitoxin [Candidatus Dormibacteria bacterium]
MRTTADIDADILEAARALARARAVSLGRALSDLARAGLSPSPSARTHRRGFPVFRVPPGAAPITEDLVAAALDES